MYKQNNFDEAYVFLEHIIQYSSDKEIQSLASNYTKLLNSCFNRHAAKMFIPSDCNNLKLMDQKKSELIDLGIQLEQGERIKL